MKQNRFLMKGAVAAALIAALTVAAVLAGCGSTQSATGEGTYTIVKTGEGEYSVEANGMRYTVRGSSKEEAQKILRERVAADAAEAAEAERLANLPPSTPEDFTYTLNEDGKGLTITGYKGTSPNVVVPREIEGFPVKNIGSEVFRYYDGVAYNGGKDKKMPLRSVTLPDTLEYLGPQVFEYSVIGSITIPAAGVKANSSYSPFRLASITTLTFEKTSPTQEDFLAHAKISKLVLPSGITVLPAHLWGLDKTALQSITIPDTVTKIEDRAFAGIYDPRYPCGLRSITLPARLTEIGANAFFLCDKLTSVVIPDSVTKIGVSAFVRCDALSSVTLPKGLTEIPDNLFEDIKNLKSITIPDTVKKIGRKAFSGSGLESLTLPAGLEEIGRLAFANCENLRTITIPDSITRISFPTENSILFPNNAFSGCPTPPLAVQAKLRQLGYRDDF
jgi:hypothetical protein